MSNYVEVKFKQLPGSTITVNVEAGTSLSEAAKMSGLEGVEFSINGVTVSDESGTTIYTDTLIHVTKKAGISGN